MMFHLWLILHFIGLALLLGASFASFTLGLGAKGMPPDERVKFLLRASVVGKNGSVGLVLMLVSGVGLLMARGVAASFALGGGAFHSKLTLFLILSGLHGLLQVQVKRAKQAQGGPSMERIPKIGGAMLLIGLAIVVLAVLAFH